MIPHRGAFTASCLCGGVRFEVAGELEGIQLCHCGQCRKAQGSAFAANVPVAVSAVRWLTGRDLVTHYASSPGKRRCFCRRCGSPLYSERDSVPNVWRVRCGIFDDPLPVRPVSHAHMASKADWWDIDDGLPTR